MNYRHAFHAGNFADVHKHVVLLALLERLKQKPKPLFYLDTHAGRGGYDLFRLVVEQTVSINTAAAGGNASLMSLSG